MTESNARSHKFAFGASLTLICKKCLYSKVLHVYILANVHVWFEEIRDCVKMIFSGTFYKDIFLPLLGFDLLAHNPALYRSSLRVKPLARGSRNS